MKRASCILGLVVSIIIVINGISTYFSANNSFMVSGTKFGADFYTEIFEEVEQVKASTRSIDNAIYEIGGLLLISIGSVSFCAFLYAISNLLNKDGKPKKVDNFQCVENDSENTVSMQSNKNSF